MLGRIRRDRSRGSRALGTLLIVAVVAFGSLVAMFSVSRDARAVTVSPAGSSDYADLMSTGAYTDFVWTHTPVGTPTLVTLVCGAQNTGIAVSATYGGLAMTKAIANQQGSFYVGMFYLINPPAGAQTVDAWLSKGGGDAYAECSVTTWTGASGVDLSIAATNQALKGDATSISLAPKAAVPANEVFFAAMYRAVWGSPTAVAVDGSGATPSIVDSNTASGYGVGYGCQDIPGTADYGCIGSAQLPAGGTSMSFFWTYGAFTVVAGFGIRLTPIWAPGYRGNAIYLTEGLANNNNPLMIFPSTSTSGGVAKSQGNGGLSTPNAINLEVGQDPNTPVTASQVVFEEVYMTSQGWMDVYIPFGAVGADYISALANIGCVRFDLSITNAPNSKTYLLSNWDVGMNTSGWSPKGPARSQYVVNLILDGLGFLPGVGYVTGSIQSLSDANQLIGTDSTAQQLDTNGGATASLLFNVVGGSQTQNVYDAGSSAHVTFGYQDFNTASPIQLTLKAVNELSEPPTAGCLVGGTGYYDSAAAAVGLFAYPAGAMSGTVHGPGGAPLANAILSFNQQTTGVFQGATFNEYNSRFGSPGTGYGMYAFAGQPGATYSVFATYNTPFGTAVTPSQSVTAPSSPTSLTPASKDFNVPVSDITGTVTDSATGARLAVATVTVTNSAGKSYSTLTDGNGNYVVWTATTGTYTVAAARADHTGQSYAVNVAAMGSTYTQNFALVYHTPYGCVLAGTRVAVPGGTVAVDDLAAGATVLGYNTTTDTWVRETVLGNSYSYVNRIVSVNDGLLEITPTDQPLWVANGSWVGWVHDPQNLSVGEKLFVPGTRSWIAITDLETLRGHFKVYDLMVTFPNDFLANGVLTLDKKT